MKKEKNILLGAHISTAGHLHDAFGRAADLKCTTIQIFTKSSRMWHGKKITEEEATLFKDGLKKSGLTKIMAHCGYLVNIGTSKKDTRKKSINSLIQELERCVLLNIPYLVLHTGARIDISIEESIELAAEGLDTVLKEVAGTCTILLEIAAGQGSTIGRTFEELRDIRNKSKLKKRVGVCIDTCHMFSAGYDISPDNYEKVWKDFDNIVGIENLKAIHLNDSKGDLGCLKDRHEKIGKGKIPKKTFELIMNDKRFINVPKVLETPIEESHIEYQDELKWLRKLVK